MNLLFISDQLAPICGKEPLGRVIAGQTAALSALGHKVTAILPLRDEKGIEKWSLARRLSPIVVELPKESIELRVFDGRLPTGVEVKLIGHDELFLNRSWGAGLEAEDDALRYFAFARAALAVAESEPTEWHVIHGVGLPGALASYLSVASRGGSAKRVLSLSSLEDQGRCDRSWVDRLGLDWESFTPAGLEFYGDLSLLKAGLVTADRILLPGSSAALGARGDQGFGLEGVVTSRGDAVLGLSPGLDYSQWNPATDVHVPARYDAELLTGKLSCKADLQNRLGLPVRSDIPLLAMLPPLSDLARPLSQIMDRLLRGELQIVAPRGLAAPLEAHIDDVLGQWPDRIVRLELDERSEHQLLAGADFAIVDAPADAEARALLAALRYGALPIVRHQAMARDLVVNLTSTLESGNGFSLDSDDPKELVSTVRRAVAAYGRLGARETRPMSRAMTRAMATPQSYEDVAHRLEQVYGEVLPSGVDA